jgi:PAT family beta-lactamase induction signal transducer AmpG
MLRKMLTRKMLTILCLGIAAGIPLGIVLTVLQAWMTKSGIDLKTIGLAVLVQMPYTWKFVWSPLMDRFVPPFLGRRRGWMLISQVLMIVSIVAMGRFDPAHAIVPILALATLISFAGASHDIVIDAYRRDVLDESELGFGSAVAVNSYLIGFRYIGVVLGLFLGDFLP